MTGFRHNPFLKGEPWLARLLPEILVGLAARRVASRGSTKSLARNPADFAPYNSQRALTRRSVRAASGLAFCILSAIATKGHAAEPIDRHALVTRHNVVLRQFDIENPLTVGNGEFAFTADATGLQTFPDAFTNTIPLGTLSHWGWHTFPNPQGWSIEKFKFQEFPDLHGRLVPYADVPGNRQTPETRWLRANPHRLHLGQIGFVLKKSDGTAAQTNDLTDVEQTLDLWDGELVSRFKLDGQPVEVHTVCHPTRDLLAVRVVSPLLKTGRIAIQLHFPYGTGDTKTADWTRPEAHTTVMTQPKPNAALFARKLDDDTYNVAASWTTDAALKEVARHQFLLTPAKGAEALDFVCGFAPKVIDAGLPGFDQTLIAAREHWKQFWSTGGAIDLSGSKDPRWHELERRIVLSQYLTAIQCAGEYPPPETGLTYNTWEGKFHLEMHWWHEAHFALWDRLPLLEKSLGYYQSILPRAEATAQTAGLRRRALAEDDLAQRRGIAVIGRAVPRLAAAAPDLLRRTVLPRPRRPRHAGEVQGHRFRDGGVHGLLCHLG